MPDPLPLDATPQPPAWDAVAENFRRAFPTLDQDEVQRLYENARSLRIARERHREWTPPPVHTAIQAFPLAGNEHNRRIATEIGRASRRISEGRAQEGDYDILAQHERTQVLAGNQSVGEAALDLGLGVVRMLGEALLGARALGAVAEGVPYLGAPLRAIGLGAEVPAISPYGGMASVARVPAAFVGRTAAQTAMMPSMYVEDAIRRNTEAGRDPMDIAGFPPAFAVGMIQTAILGSIGRQVNTAFPGPGIGQTLRRIGYAGPIGLIEQQIADTLGYATGLQTGYGVLGDLFSDTGNRLGLGTPAKPDAWKHTVSSWLAFAAFAGLHESGQRQGAARERVLRDFVDEAQRLSREGIPRTEAAMRLLGRLEARYGPYEQRGTTERGRAPEARPEVTSPAPEGGMPRVSPFGQQPPAGPRPTLTERMRARQAAQEASVRTPEPLGRSAPVQERSGVQGAKPERPLADPVVVKQMEVSEKTANAKEASLAQPKEKPFGAGLSEKAKEKELAKLIQSQADDAAGRVSKKRAKEYPAPESVVQAVRESKLDARQKKSLEAVLNRTPLRDAESAIGVSYEQIRHDARKAFEALKKEKPDLFGKAETLKKYLKDETVEGFILETKTAAANALRDKAGTVSERDLANVPEGKPGRQATGKAAKDAAVDRMIELEDAISHYKPEIEASRAQLEKEGRMAGRSREEVQRDIEEARREALEVAERQRSSRPARQDVRAPEAKPAERPAPAAEQRTEPVGLPGGGQENATGVRRVTALANEKVEAERKIRQESPLEQAARKENQKSWDEAKATHERDPQAIERLLRELAEKPRPTTVEESAILLHEKIRVNNEYEKTVVEYIKTGRDEASLPRVLELEAKEAELRARQDLIDQISHKTGSEAGRSFQFRRQLAARDYTLAGMLFKTEKAKGERLTREEQAKIIELQKELAEKNKEIESLKGDELNKKLFEYEEKIKEYQKIIDRFERAKKPKMEKVGSWILDLLDLHRTTQLGADLPPMFRQGAPFTAAHPIESVTMLAESSKALKKEGAFAIEQKIKSNPSVKDGTAARAGLDLTSMDGNLTSRPEEFRSSLLQRAAESESGALKYTGLKTVAQGYTALGRWNSSFMNLVRVRWFELLRLARGAEVTEAENKVFANAINVATGRGNMNWLKPGAIEAASHVFTSPRFVLSRVQYLIGQPLWTWGPGYKGTFKARAIVAKEMYAKPLLGLALVMGLAYSAKKAGADVDVDLEPRSSDFGKIRWGNTRFDPYAGVQQVAVLGARVLTGRTVVGGQNIPAYGEGSRPGQRVNDIGWRFVRGKLSPAVGVGWDTLTRETMIGEPFGPLRSGRVSEGSLAMGRRIVVPITVSDIAEAYQDLGLPRGLASMIWALFGGNLQSHSRLSRR